MLLLDQPTIARLLTMDACIDVMAEALATLARGDAVQPLRPIMPIPGAEGSVLALMPSFLGAPRGVGVQVITVFPGNHGTALDSHQGAVLLFDADDGRLLGVFDATAITAIRTAAVSGLATRLLARDDATKLAIIGSGVQARTHLEAMLAVRPFARLAIWSRSAERAAAFAREAAARGIETTLAASAADAVRDADVVCTTTSAREPVLRGEWLPRGVHVNAVGASVRAARELDSEAVVRSRLFVDRRESALREPGDIIVPLEEGAITPDHIVAELGEVVIGRAAGRASPDEITLFKSLGLAIEDLAAAQWLYATAQRDGAGQWVELGGVRADATSAVDRGSGTVAAEA